MNTNGVRRWFLALLTLLAGPALAHEGHQPLPTKGVQVDVERGHVTLSRAARELIGIEATEVATGQVASRVRAYATVVTPWGRRANVSSRLAGRILQLGVVPGAEVQRLQPLAEIDSVELQSLRADALRAVSDRNLAQTLFEALSAAAKGGSIPGQRLVDAETSLRQSEIAVEVARAKALGLKLGEDAFDPGNTAPLRIRPTAPIDGVVLHSDAAVGKYVDATDHLFEIVDPRRVWVQIPILERDLHRLQVGQGVELRFAALGNAIIRSTISRLDRWLDPVTHQVNAWVDLDLDPMSPGPVAGMTGTAEILSLGTQEGLTIPLRAVFSDGAERYVFVEETSTRTSSEYRKRTVVLGRRSEETAELVSGEVYPGDRVVVRGGHELSSLFFLGVLRLGEATARAIGLKTDAVTDRTIDQILRLDAAVEIPPQQRMEISPQVAGVLHSIRVDRSQPVERGEPLFEIASLELQDAQLDLIQAKLSRDTWAELLDRRRSGGEAVPARVLAETEKQAIGAATRLATLKEKLLTIGLTGEEIESVLTSRRIVDAVTVRSPLAGTVVRFDGVLGQTLPANQPILEIHQLSHPRIIAYVPQQDAAKVAVGQKARIELTAYPGRELTGVIARQGPGLIPGSRTQAVWIDFDSPPEELLLHNMLARVVISTATPSTALAVGRGAIVQDRLQSYVFVRKSDGTFDRRRVTLGRADDRVVEIVSGVTRGETVATGGVPQLQTAYASVR